MLMARIQGIYCLAHIRRKFHDIIVHLDEESLKKSHAIIGFNYCEKLYKIERYLRMEYSKKLLPNMKTFLTDGSLEIDNNGAERAINPFVIGRKN